MTGLKIGSEHSKNTSREMAEPNDERIEEHNGIKFCICDGLITGLYSPEGKYIPRSEFSKELEKIAKKKTLHAMRFKKRFSNLGGV